MTLLLELENVNLLDRLMSNYDTYVRYSYSSPKNLDFFPQEIFRNNHAFKDKGTVWQINFINLLNLPFKCFSYYSYSIIM